MSVHPNTLVGQIEAVADYDAADREFAASLITQEAVQAALAGSDRPVDPAPYGEAGERLAKLVWNRYLDSVAMVRALAERYNFPVVFAWQPAPFFATAPTQRILDPLHRLFRAGAFAAPVYHWLHARNFPGMGESAGFVDVSQVGKGLDAVLYLDVCHYTRAMADAIAEALAGALALRL